MHRISRTGRIVVLYNISLQLLGSIFWHLRIIFKRLSAFAIALLICTDQDNVLLIVTPRCVWLSTSDIFLPFRNRSGWFERLRCLDIIKYSVLIALNSMSHCSPNTDNRWRSLFTLSKEVMSIIGCWTEVSSSKRFMKHSISSTKALIYIKNKRYSPQKSKYPLFTYPFHSDGSSNTYCKATNPSLSSHIPVGLNFLFPNFESKIL